MAAKEPVALLPVKSQQEGCLNAEVASYDGKDLPYGDVLQDCLIRLVGNDPSLVELSLARYHLTDVHMRLLWLALKDNTHLIDLNISHNSIKDAGLPWLWNLLRDNNTIRRLNAAHNGWSATSLRQLEDAVTRNIALTYFKVEERASMGKVTFLHNCPLVLGVRNSFKNALELNCPVQKMETGQCDYVHIVNRSLETFPVKLTSYVHLRELNLSHNRLFDLPKALSKLTNLESIRVNNNCLVDIPLLLCQMPALTELDCSDNLLTYVPFSLATMTGLRHLNLAANHLSPDGVPLRLLFDNEDSKRVVNLSRNHASVKMTREEDKYGWHHATSRVVIAGNEDIGGLLRGSQFIYGGKKASKMLQSVLRRLIDEAQAFHPFFISTYPLFAPAAQQSDKGPRARKDSHEGATATDKSKKKLLRSRTSTADGAIKTGSTLSASMGARRSSLQPPGPGDLQRMRSNSSFAMARDAMQGAIRSIVHTQPLEIPSMENARQALLECVEVGEHPIAPMLMFKGHNIVVVTVRLDPKDSEGDMLDYAARWINTVKSDVLVFKQANAKQKAAQGEPMSVVLVPCYTTAQVDKSEVRHRTKLLMKQFEGDVLEVVPVCTQSGNGLGKLLRLLSATAAESHSSGRQSTVEERLLSEKIRLIKETKQLKQEAAVLSWAEFQDIAAESGMANEKDTESAAAFLASTGAVIHYSRLECRPVTFLNTEPVRKWIFLDESLLRKAMDQVLQNAVIVNWVPLMNRQHLSMFWGDIEEKLHPTLLILFEHFGLLSPIMRTLQAAHEQDVCYVVPGAVVRPGHKNVCAPETIRHFTSRDYLIASRAVPPIGRVVHFKNMHPAIFGRVLAELAGSLDPSIANINLVTEGCIHIVGQAEGAWTSLRKPEKPEVAPVVKEFSGVNVAKRPQAGAVILFDNTHNRLLLFAWEGMGDLIRHVLTLVNRALSEERFADTIERTMVTCMHCLNKGMDILDCSVFELEDLNNLAADGATYAYCTRAARCGVRIDVIAPDVVLQIKETMRVNYSDLEVFEKVGSGAFGVVYRAKRKKEGDDVAVKMIQLDEDADKTEKFAEFRHEVQLMADLQHPCLVSLLGICNEPLCLVTDFCPEGDLATFLQQRNEDGKPLSVAYIHQVVLDIAKGLAFLHSSTPPVLHLDLKSPNILLMQKPGGEAGDGSDGEGNLCVADPTKPVAKVADFGLSNSSFFPKSERMVDNPLWLAPEVMENKPYSTPSDVYGIGIIANELFSLEIPFHDFNEKFSFRLENRIVAGERPTVPSWCPGEYKSLIQRCWAADPLERPSISELIAELKALRPEKASPDEEPLADPAETVNITVTVDAAAGESCTPGQHEDAARAQAARKSLAEEELEGFGDELLSFFEEVRNSSTEMPAISPKVAVKRKSSRSRSCLAATLDVTDDDEEEEELLARESTVTLDDVLPVSKKTTAAPEDEGMTAKESKKDKKKQKAEKKAKKANETKEERKARKAKKKEKKDKLRKPGHAKGTAVAAESRKGEDPAVAPAAAMSSQAGDPPDALGGKQKATAAQPSARVRALEEKALALAETARRLQEEALELERIALEEMENEQLEQEQGQGHQADAAKESASENSEELPDLEAV